MKYIENDNVELKRLVNDKVEKAMVAFLNSFDGTIYIGINDDGTIVGIDKVDECLRRIADIVSDKIEPSALEYVQIKSIQVDDKHIIEIKVKKGINSIYHLKTYGLSAKGVFVRVGTSNRSLTTEEIKARFVKSIDYKEPSLTEVESRFEILTFNMLKQHYLSKGFSVNEVGFESTYHLRTKNNKYNLMAELLADKNDFSLKIVRFQGKDKTVMTQRDEYGGKCLISSIDQMLLRLETENITKVDINSWRRKERKLFNMTAAREALFNAVAHQKWDFTAYPAIYIFSDRLEIISYGGMPIGQTKESFLKGISIPRNIRLMEILTNFEYAEQSGHGVPDIVNIYGEKAIEITEHYINVIIPFDVEVFGTNIDTNIGTNSLEEKIIYLISQNNKITQKTISKMLNIPERSIKREFAKSRRIVRIGGNHGHWEIK